MNPTRQLLRSAPRLASAARTSLGLSALAVARRCPAQFSPAAFSTQRALLKQDARFRGGPLWDKGEVVTYDELKPLTENPDDVSRELQKRRAFPAQG